jgi:hypothetical protein
MFSGRPIDHLEDGSVGEHPHFKNAEMFVLQRGRVSFVHESFRSDKHLADFHSFGIHSQHIEPSFDRSLSDIASLMPGHPA